MSREFIFKIDGALYNEETGELCVHPELQGELVRCKDCKKNPHWEWVGCPMTGKGTRKPDDFCSYAERREE